MKISHSLNRKTNVSVSYKINKMNVLAFHMEFLLIFSIPIKRNTSSSFNVMLIRSIIDARKAEFRRQTIICSIEIHLENVTIFFYMNLRFNVVFKPSILMTRDSYSDGEQLDCVAIHFKR